MHIYLILIAQISFSLSVDYNPSPNVLEVGDESFMIAIRYNQDKDFISKPMVNITLETRKYTRLENGTQIKIKTPVFLEPCTLDHFKKLPSPQFNWTTKFQEMNLHDFLCLERGKKYQIGGKWENENFYHLKFTTKQCVNSTTQAGPWQPVCDSPENIKKLLPINPYINIVTSNFYINPENSTQSTSQFFDSQIYSIQPNAMYTTTNVMLNEQTIETDTSLLSTPEVSHEDYIVYKPGDFIQQTIVGSFSTYNEVYFLRSSFSTKIKRHFLKLGDVLSYIGGFSQVFIIVAAISVHFYNKLVFTVELANRLYDFDVIRDPKQVVKRDSKILQDNLSRDGDNKCKKENAFQKRLSLARDGKVIDREDHGLIPLQQIKQKILEKNNDSLKVSSFSNQLENVSQSIIRKSDREDIFENNKCDIDQSPPAPMLQESVFQQIDSFQLNESKQQEQSKNNVLTEGDDDEQDLEAKAGKNQENQNRLRLPPLNLGQQLPYDYNIAKFNRGSLPAGKQKIILPLSGLDSPQSISSKRSHKNQVYPLNDSYNSPQNKQQLNDSDGSIAGRKEQSRFTNTKTFLEQEIKFILQRNRQVELTFKFVLNKLTCGKYFKSREVMLLKKAEKMVIKDLDIFTILDKMKQLDKLKKLFLSRQQETLFNFFPKPFISIAKQQHELNLEQLKNESLIAKNEMNKQKQHKKSVKSEIKPNQLVMIAKVVNRFKHYSSQQCLTNYQQLFECYRNLIHQNRTKSEAYQNEKLIELLGQELKSIFEVAELMNKASSRKGKRVESRNRYTIIKNKSLFSQDTQITGQVGYQQNIEENKDEEDEGEEDKKSENKNKIIESETQFNGITSLQIEDPPQIQNQEESLSNKE